MPLFTSNSESIVSRGVEARREYRWPIAWTLLMTVLSLVALEVVTRFGFGHISRIESRIHQEHMTALAARPAGAGSANVLMLGNSLLLEAMDYDEVRKTLPPRIIPVRFVIENTAYLDWYYGIKRLFGDGTRVNYVVVCLSIDHFLSNSTLGDYSSFYLFPTSDIVTVGRRAGMDNTEISSLFFARYSLFYAGRNNMRNFILNRLDPAYTEVLRNVVVRPARPRTDAEVLASAVPRLEALRDLCARHDAKFLFLLPPGFEPGANGLSEAGRQAGVPILIPVPQNAWQRNMFRDGFHLNHAGSVQFTARLINALGEAILK
jgi:hypothetical protein